ncbi:beta-ketoacyl-[acyl-carrier-protein] synthase family protein [Streptomyces hygroscopicus]|uniref:beta-ketoacyl-[acyl-carrier-protein] synthase family protein n=1 Tax=Streptomyces hygroscopicus TaxID=1912 RepID=UPI0037BC20D0
MNAAAEKRTSVHMKEVVVTGIGATTPLAGDAPGHWQALLDGRSAVDTLPYEWAQSLRTRIAAELAADPDAHFDRKEARRFDRVEKAALVATREAWADAGLDDDPVRPERLAVCVGTGMGGLTTVLGQERLLESRHRVSAFTVTRTMSSGPAACVGVELGARAGIHSVASACATGSEAIAMGADLIRYGRADVVVAGGADAVISRLALAGFGALRALSTRNDAPRAASRPWDKDRDGFVLGEGAGVLVLEQSDHAAARGARVYARLAGAGVSSDGYDLVRPRPDGAGIADAMTKALKDGGIVPAEVAHVNAHATGTPVGDMIEVAAVRRVIGDHPVLTANKSLHGHLLGAAGAVESIAAVRSVHDGVIPPTLNLDNPESGLELDVVTGKPRRMEVPVVLKTSYGFGGQNVALLFTRA